MADLKRIWEVEQDLLDEFVRVCNKYDLTYFLNGGTQLGAIRHKGFIPWDDDIDVIMPRDDYNKLWKIAEKEFKDPYFFQTTLSEDNFYRPHAQLRNSNTTGYNKYDAKKPHINKGIFIDILVYDGIPDNRLEYEIFRAFVKFQKALLSYEYDRDKNELSTPKKAFYIFAHAFFKVVPFKKYFTWFNESVLGHYKNTRRVADLTLQWGKNVEWERSWYDETIYVTFEGKEYAVPKQYDEILKKQYGNYMEIPKDKKNNHGELVFDTENSYKVRK